MIHTDGRNTIANRVVVVADRGDGWTAGCAATRPGLCDACGDYCPHLSRNLLCPDCVEAWIQGRVRGVEAEHRAEFDRDDDADEFLIGGDEFSDGCDPYDAAVYQPIE